MRSYSKIFGDKRRAHAAREDWFSAVEAIVAEVDPRTMAVKVIIPSIDEDRVHDEWVDALMPWVGPDGYGPAHLPAIGSEVILFSRLNEGVTLFYLSKYNEDFRPPAEFADGARGLKTEADYRLISEGDLYLRGGRVIIEADASVRITAPGGFFVNGKRIA